MGPRSLLTTFSVFASNWNRLFFSGTLILLFLTLSSKSHVSAFVCCIMDLKELRARLRSGKFCSWEGGLDKSLNHKEAQLYSILGKGRFIIQTDHMSTSVLGCSGGEKNVKEGNFQ